MQIVIGAADAEKYKKKSNQITLSNGGVEVADAAKYIKPQSPVDNFDKDILKAISDNFKSSWNYDVFDAEDMTRKAQGLMPKAVESKYNFKKNEYDQYLFDNGLPYTSKFSTDYQGAEAKNTEEKQKKTAYSNTLDDFYGELNAAAEKWQRDEMTKARAEKRSPKLSDMDWEQLITGLLTQDKFGDIADNFTKRASDEETEGYDAITAKSKADKQKVNENAFTADDIINGYFEYQKYKGSQNAKAPSLGLTAPTPQPSQVDAEYKAALAALKPQEDAAPNTVYESDISAQIRALQTENEAINAQLQQHKKTPEIINRANYHPLDTSGRTTEKTLQQKKTQNEAQIKMLEKATETLAELEPYNALLGNTDFQQLAAKGRSVIPQTGKKENTYINSADNPMDTRALKYRSMSEDEKNIYNYLLAKDNSGSEAQKYLDILNPLINARAMGGLETRLQDMGRENPVASSIMSVPMSLAKGEGFLKASYDKMQGKEIDPNAPYFMASMGQGAIRGAVSEDMTPTMGFLYNTGMSIVDFAAAAPAGAAALPIMGAGAATDTMRNILERGGNDTQAIIGGGLAGLAEAVFEKFSLDNVVKLASPGAISDFVKNAVKSAGIEASEEIFTEITNKITDAIIMSDLSQYNYNVQNYITSGMSADAAKKRASVDSVVEVTMAGLGGLLSGGVMGAGAQAVGALRTNQQGSQLNQMDGATQGLIQAGLEMPAGTQANTLAQTLGGTTPSNMQAGMQYRANIEAQQAAEAAEAAEQRAVFENDVLSIGMDVKSVNTALSVYDRLTQNQNVTQKDVNALNKLNNVVKQTLEEQAEISADAQVARAEALSRLTPFYDAIMQSYQAGDVNGFQQASAKYMREYQLTQQRAAAEQIKTENRISNVVRKAETEISGVDASIPIFHIDAQTNELNAANPDLNGIITQSAQGGMIGGGQQIAHIPAGGSQQRAAISDDAGAISLSKGNFRETGPQNRTGQPSEGSVGTVQQGSGENPRVTRGLAATPEADYIMSEYARIIQVEAGALPNVKIVNEVEAETAKILDQVKSVTGWDAFLYESNDKYADGFRYSDKIFLPLNTKRNLAFTYGHEIAHADRLIHKAGMMVADTLTDKQLESYRKDRNSHFSIPDNADIKSELVSDMFGDMMMHFVTGTPTKDFFGLDGDTINKFHDAFSEALGAPELLESVKEAAELSRHNDKFVEYTRANFTGEDGQEYSYSMPQIRQRKDGTYYVKFQVDGVAETLESKNRADLENAIRKKKQDHAYKNASTAVLNLREAARLFENGITVGDYANQSDYSHEVSKQLRGMYLRNGIAVGGALSEPDLIELTKNQNNWKNRRQGYYTMSSAQRIAEDIGDWRKAKTINGAVVENHLEGEDFKDKTWGYVKDQGAAAIQWMEDNHEIIREVFDGEQSTSTLAQMLGESVIAEADAGSALYDKKHMVLRAGDAVYIFDKLGQIKAVSAEGKTLVFDENYYKRHKEAKEAVAKITKIKDKYATTTEYHKAVEDARKAFLSRAKPVQIDGTIQFKRNGNSATATLPSGKPIAEIKNGKTPNVDNAIKLRDALRGFYDRAYGEQNAALVENGYKRMNKRENYFPHQGKATNNLQEFIKVLSAEESALPTAIAGLTSGFNPGRPYTSHLLERLGDFTEFDAIRGFERYLTSAADLIYYTPTIQRIRQIEKNIRENSPDTQNANLANWLHNYGNSLANKKSDLDRGLENMLGREIYSLSSAATKLFGAAAVAGNLSSALSNNISLLSSIPGLEKKYIAPAMRDTVRGMFGQTEGDADAFADKFPSLVRRFGGFEKILTTDLQKAKRVGSKALGFTFELVDRFAVETVARAKYNELMNKGYTEDAAIKRTDDFLVKMFAERSKGMTPMAANVAWARPLMQFQLEGINQLSHFRDLNRQHIAEQIDQIIAKNNGVVDGVDWAAMENQISSPNTSIKTIARKIMYLLLMFLYNRLVTRPLMNRDQALDPLGAGVDIAKTATAGGNVLEKTAEIALDQLPLISTFTGGRTPVMGGVDKVMTAVQDLTDEDLDVGEKAISAMQGVASFVPGGAQISKTIRGIDAISKGGSYSKSDKLRYPVSEDEYWKMVLFGPAAAAPEDYNYLTGTLSDAQTKNYRQLVDAGIDSNDAYNLLRDMDTDTKAGGLASIATYDADGDGEVDFTDPQMQLIAGTLGINIKKSKKSIPEQAQKAADDYIKGKRKEKDLAPEKLAEAEEYYHFLLKVLGQ